LFKYNKFESNIGNLIAKVIKKNINLRSFNLELTGNSGVELNYYDFEGEGEGDFDDDFDDEYDGGYNDEG